LPFNFIFLPELFSDVLQEARVDAGVIANAEAPKARFFNKARLV
jgi:hypothetical protein